MRAQQLTAKQAKAVLGAFADFADGGVRLLPAFRQAAGMIQKMPGLRAGDALHLSVAVDAAVQEFATLDYPLAVKARELKLNLTAFAGA